MQPLGLKIQVLNEYKIAEISKMFARFFLSALVLGLFASFSGVGSAAAKKSKDYYVSKKAHSKYLKRRAKASRSAKRRAKANRSAKRRAKANRSAKRRTKTRRLSRKKRNISYPIYSSRKKKATKASLGLASIKNSRHARLTSRGRMSVAKDTRRKTVRSYGQRVSYKYRPGTIVISNFTRRLYYVVRRGKVISYPIATPRPDEVWSGSTKISKKKFNPDWYPTPGHAREKPQPA